MDVEESDGRKGGSVLGGESRFYDGVWGRDCEPVFETPSAPGEAVVSEQRWGRRRRWGGGGMKQEREQESD